MSWVAYYVEVSSHQQQQEYARRFAHRRPEAGSRDGVAARRPSRRHWWHGRLHGPHAGTGLRTAYRRWHDAAR